MMRDKRFFCFLIVCVFFCPFVSSAHFVVGYVHDALDGTKANGYEIVLWNPTNGIGDNVTDIIGPDGNSGADNIYFVDCEMLNNPCDIGDELKIKVLNNGSGYNSEEASVIVTGGGYDVAPNLTLNSFPRVGSVFVDDNFYDPVGEIDLTPFSTKRVVCEGAVYDYDGESSISNISAIFFDVVSSFYSDINDNNKHYSNKSCYIDYGYGGPNEVYYNCSFEIEYYANSNYWNCTVKAEDNLSVSAIGTNTTFINVLLALSIDSPVYFHNISPQWITDESVINVTNAGNSIFNLTLSGYARTSGDGYTMNCSNGLNISVEYMKYNLTVSNPGDIPREIFETRYVNLTADSVIKRFNLDYRRDDGAPYLDDTNSTYWRMYVPFGFVGNCTGNIVFGAVKASEGL